MSVPLVKFIPLEFHILLCWYGLLRWSSIVCSVGKLCSIEVPLFASFVRFALLVIRLCYLVSSVRVPVSVPLVWFAPIQFQCLLRWSTVVVDK